MSREVEVSNIQMTATVPEDIQLSLGTLAKDGSTDYSLAKGTGVISTGTATTPSVTDGEMWSNTADISAYYQIGKLIPASSTTGENIFFTPDANGEGKTVKSNAKYYSAATNKTATTDSGTGTNKTRMATLHAFTVVPIHGVVIQLLLVGTLQMMMAIMLIFLYGLELRLLMELKLVLRLM